MRKSILTLVALLALTLTAGAQSVAGKFSPRTALLVGKEKARKSPDANLSPDISRLTFGDSVVSAYLTINPATLDREALADLGVTLCLEVGQTATARIPLSSLPLLAEVEGLEYIQASTDARPMLDIARTETGAADMQAGISLPQPFTGQGVVVGIVDSGFDYGHAAFRDAYGQLRIKRVWEQGAKGSGSQTSPAPFGYGVELTSPEEILAAGGDIRNNSHGTHVTSIAASSSAHADGMLRGMAPEADIVLVSMTEAGTNNVNISNAIAYIFQYADQTGQPCVVNLSLGTHSGPHDGTSTFDRLADQMQGPGRLIVGAAGNFTTPFHVAHRFAEEEKGKPFSTFISYIGKPADSQLAEVEIWATAEARMKVALVLYKLNGGQETDRAEINLAEGEVSTLSLGRNVTGNFLATAETSPLNGKTHVLLQSAVTAIRSGYAVAIEVTPQAAGALDIWAEQSALTLTSNNLEGFAAPTAESPTICEIGGTAQRILTVGAYATRASYTLFGSTVAQPAVETDGDLCSFSCYGPTADGRLKPEVTAPGAYISAAVSQYDDSGTILLSNYIDEDGQVTKYGYMEGTSMACPVVTGIVAAWLQAHPTLTPEGLKEIVQATARTDSWTGTSPAMASARWGYGKIDALAGLRECLARTAIESPEATDLPTDAPTRIYTLTGLQLPPSSTLPRGTYLMVTPTSSGNIVRKFTR